MSSEARLIDLLDELEGQSDDDVIIIGDVPSVVWRFWPPRPARLILTGERYRHIRERHPEMRGLKQEFIKTLLDPDEVHRNRRDTQMVILIRALPGATHYLRVAMLLSNDERLQHSIISAWKMRRDDYQRGVKQGAQLWRRGA